MKDQNKTKDQLIAELEELRGRVSDQKRAEEALRSSEAKYRRLHQSMMDAFVEVDIEGHIQEYNEAYRAMLGYEPEELLSLRYQDLTPEKWHSYEAEIVEKQILALGHSEIYEKEYRRKDGTIFPVELRAFLIRDDHGEPSAIWGIARDITERRRAQAALQKAHNDLERRVEERTAELAKANERLDIFRRFADASGEGFGMSDFEGSILYANPALCRLFGEAKPEDVVGKQVSTYYPEAYLQRRKSELIPSLLEKGYWHAEQIVLPRHGSPIQTEQSTFLIRDRKGKPFRIAVVVSDITERKRAEEELRRSQATLDAFFNASTAILNIFDDEYRYIKCDPLTASYFNLDAKSIVGRSLKDELAPQFVEEFGPMIRRVIETGEPVSNVEVESPVPSRPGEIVYWRASYFPLALPEGKRGYGVVGVDINDIKRAEDALRESEAKYRVLVETSPDTVVLADLQGHITFVSHGILELHGSESLEEFLGKHPLDFIVPEDHQRFLENLQRTLEEGVTRDLEYTFVRKDGTRFPGEVTGAVIRDAMGQPTALMAVVRDITERKLTAEALLASETKYRQLVETTGTGYLILDGQGRVIDANAEYVRLSGHHSLEEILGRTVVEWTAPYHVDRNAREVETCYQKGVVRQLEIDYIHPDGKIVPIEINATCLDTTDGRRIVSLCRDVTERRQAHEALRQSHEELRAIYGGMPDGLLVADIETKRFVRCNTAMRHMLGYSEDELLSRSVMDIHPAEAVSGVLETFRAFADGRQRIGHCIPMLRKDGSVFHADITHNEITFNGRRCTVGFFRDITERTQAEETVKESESKLKTLFQMLPVGIALLDEHHRIVDVNPALGEILGMTREGLLGGDYSRHRYVRSDGALMPSEEYPSAIAMKEGSVVSNVEIGVVKEDGTTVWTSVSAAPLPVRGLKAAVVTRDITEHKRAEEALRASEERFRVAFDKAPVGVVMVIGDGILARANSSFCRMCGYTEEELIGMSILAVTHPDDQERSQTTVRRLLAGESQNITMEKRYVRKDGSLVWGQATNTAVHDRNGNILFALGIIEDITERKQAQEALLRERRTLKHMLKASDHERQLIAYDIHDGLAQQLTGAIMQFQTFAHLKDAKPKDAAKAFDAGTTMLQQSHFEARRLISGVRPPVLDESGVMAAIAHLVHDPAFDQGPRIDFRSRVTFKRLPSVLENVIYRIVQEGLANARNHSKGNKILVRLVQRDERLRIEIRDWGIGFDPKTVQEDRFGLEGIRERARLLGGRSRIKSKPGEGTSIVVELPVVEREAEE